MVLEGLGRLGKVGDILAEPTYREGLRSCRILAGSARPRRYPLLAAYAAAGRAHKDTGSHAEGGLWATAQLAAQDGAAGRATAGG